MALTRKQRLRALTLLRNLSRILPLLVLSLRLDMKDEDARRQATHALLFSALLFTWATSRLSARIASAADSRLVREKDKPKSVQVYDEEALGLLFGQASLQYAVALASVRYFRLSPPLAFIVTIPLSLVQHPLFQVHFAGADDTDEAFERPWAAASNPVDALQAMYDEMDRKQSAAQARAAKMANGLVKAKEKQEKQERKRK